MITLPLRLISEYLSQSVRNNFLLLKYFFKHSKIINLGAFSNFFLYIYIYIYTNKQSKHHINKNKTKKQNKTKKKQTNKQTNKNKTQKTKQKEKEEKTNKQTNNKQKNNKRVLSQTYVFSSTSLRWNGKGNGQHFFFLVLVRTHATYLQFCPTK